jgi:hypothetical protein
MSYFLSKIGGSCGLEVSLVILGLLIIESVGVFLVNLLQVVFLQQLLSPAHFLKLICLVGLTAVDLVGVRELLVLP